MKPRPGVQWVLVFLLVGTGLLLVTVFRGSEKSNDHEAGHSRVRRQTQGQTCGKFDLVFVIDSSGSINAAPSSGSTTNWEKILKFCSDIVGSLDFGKNGDKIRVGAVSYSTKAQVEFDLQEYTRKSDIQDMLQQIEYQSGYTNTSGGIWVMKEQVFTVNGGDRKEAPNIALVITDGQSNKDGDKVKPYSQDAQSTIEMFGIGVTNNVADKELNNIASDPKNKHVLKVTDFKDLTSILSVLTSADCATGGTPCGSDPCLNDGTCKDVDAKTYNCTCKDGYTGIQCETSDKCSTKPCRNDGTCTLTQTGYTCTCHKGTTGTNCETNVDECESRPCLNGATCIDGVSSFTCQCAPGFTGTLCTADCGKIDLSFVIDSSSSINNAPKTGNVDNFDRILQFCRDIVNTLEIGPDKQQVGVVTYSSKAKLEFDFLRYTNKKDLMDAIWNIPYQSGNTNTSGGLWVMKDVLYTKKHGDRSTALNVAMVITDGKSNTDETKVKPYALEAQNRPGANRIEMYALGITRGVDINELNTIASDPDSKYSKRVTDFSDLSQVLSILAGAGCQPRPDPCQNNPCKNNGQCINVFGKYSCKCVGAYTGKHCDKHPCDSSPCQNNGNCTAGSTKAGYNYTCSCPPGYKGYNCQDVPVNCDRVDICFVVDSSGTIGQSRWVLVKQYLDRLVNALKIGTDQTQVGVVTYSYVFGLKIKLKASTDKATVTKAIDALTFIGQNTRTKEGLEEARTACFSAANGDRADAQNIAVLITDGGDANPPASNAEGKLIIKEGTKLHAVGYGTVSNGKALVDITGSASTVYTASNVYTLQSTAPKLMEGACRIKLPPWPCDSNPCKNGGICMGNATSYTCKCAKGYIGTLCDKKAPNCDLADICFVVDSSGTIRQDRWPLVQQYLKRIVNALNIGPDNTRVGVVTYSYDYTNKIKLKDSTDKARVSAAIDTLSFLGQNTMTQKGLEKAKTLCFNKTNGDRPDAKNIAVLVSDGGDQSPDASNKEGATMRGLGIKIHGVGYGSLSNGVALTAITGDKAKVYTAKDVNELQSTAPKLLEGACGIKLPPSPCDSNPCKNGGLCLATGSSYKCTCAKGFTGTNCDKPNCDRVDICFIVDSSGTVKPTGWPFVKAYLKRIVSALNIGPDNTQVGVVTYSFDATNDIKLKDSTDKATVSQAIDALGFRGKNTMTKKGLEMAKTQCFSSANGDRADARNIAVLVSDGGDAIPAASKVEGESMRSLKIKLHGVGYGSISDGAALTAITGDASLVYTAKDVNQLQSTVPKLLEGACSIKLPSSPCDSSPCKNGGVCVPSGTSYDCTCPQGFTGKNCDQPTTNCNKVDICFIVDSSATIGSANWPLVRRYMNSVVSALKISPTDTRVGVVIYSSEVKNTIFLRNTIDKATLTKAIDALGFLQQSTLTKLGLSEAKTGCFNTNNGDRADARNIALLISDGGDHDAAGSNAQGQAMRDAGINIHAVGFGKIANGNALVDITKNRATVYTTTDVNTLQATRPSLLQGACGIKVAMCDCNPCQNGGVCADNGGTSYTCTCKQGFIGVNCQTPKTCDKVDICFVVDSSATVNINGGWATVLQYLNSVVDSLNIGSGQVQVGVVTYSADKRHNIKLGDFKDKAALKDAIRRIPFLGQNTQTRAGLKMMRDSCFNPTYGDRSDARNIGILVSDGGDSDPVASVNEAKQAIATKIKLFGVGYGKFGDGNALISITGDSSTVYTVTSVGNLKNTKPNLLLGACNIKITKK